MNDSADHVLSLLNEHGPRLHALLVRITLREDVAEDLMQELFIKLSRRQAIARAFDPVGYAVRAATHLAFDWRRSHGRRRDATPIGLEPESTHQPHTRELEQREDLQTVLNAIEQLPPTSRDIVVMRYLEGRPYEEIAAAVSKSVHQTRALCFKSIVRLRAIAKSTHMSQATGGRL